MNLGRAGRDLPGRDAVAARRLLEMIRDGRWRVLKNAFEHYARKAGIS